MQKTKSKSGQKSIAVSSICGTGISIAVGLILSALLTFLVNGQTVAEGMIKTTVPIILYLSHTAGGLCAALLAREKRAIVALISIAATFFILTATNILFMDGSFHGLLPKAFSGLIAYATVFLILLKGGKEKKTTSKRRPR